VVGIPPAHSGLYFSRRIVVWESICEMAMSSHEVSGVASQELNAREPDAAERGLNDTEFTRRR
jgi:hypothetical protein